MAPNSGEASCRRRAREGLQEKAERDGSLLASLLMVFGCPGELRLFAGSDRNRGEARARGCYLGSIHIKWGQGLKRSPRLCSNEIEDQRGEELAAAGAVRSSGREVDRGGDGFGLAGVERGRILDQGG